jgi:general secretion pathway protein F
LKEFEYTAYDNYGNKVKSVVYSDNLQQAKSILKNQNLVVVDIKPINRKRSFIFKKNIKDEDIYNFFKELSILQKSGVKIEKALQIVSKSIKNPILSKIVEEITLDLKAGLSFSQALSKHSIFPSLAVAMVKAGESTGNLYQAFENIAQYIKFSIQFKNEVRSAMVYPTFLIFASFLTLFAMFKFIIPKFFSVFSTNSVESLPLPSKILLYLSNIFTINIYSVVFFGLIVAFFYYLKSSGVFSRFAHNFVYFPIIKDIIINLEMSKFCYSMYSMLSGGVEFLNSLNLSVDTVQNKYIKNALSSVSNEVKSGKSITESFGRVEFVPEFMVNMINVGEESGNLKEIFLELHYIFDEKFKNFVKRALTILEPSIITFTGIVVGFIVISLILTVMSLGNVKL